MSDEQIEEVMQWLRDGGEFVAGKSPIVVQDILFAPRIDAIGSLAGLVVCCVLAYVLIVCLGKLTNEHSEGLESEFKDWMFLSLSIPLFPGLVFMFSFLTAMIDMMNAHLTPNLYVIEELAKVVGGAM